MRPRAEGVAALAVGIALVFALSYLDAAWEEQVIAATVVIAPFLTAMFAGVRQTAAVAAFAVFAATLSGGYNDNYGSTDYFVRLVVVIAGAGFAIVAARSRRRLAADQQRFAVLRGAGRIAETAKSLPEVVERMGALLVPGFADVCVIDVLRGGRVERLAVVASGPNRAAIEEHLRGRDPGTAAELLVLGPLLSEGGDSSARSHIRVPLRSRGGNVGTLSLLAITRVAYGPDDLQLAQLIAGRVGLALHNAGLFAELESLQARLTTALDTLAEAVTIQDDRGKLVYANHAAAAALGFTSAADLLATPPREIADGYESFHADGRPLRLEELPGRAVLKGGTPEPILVRAINRRTGEERWRVVKASAVPAREGERRLAVNVIEDVTEVKRAELAERFLAQASAVLASALEYEQTLARIAQLAVPRLADWCSVALPDEHGQLVTVALAHSDPAKVAFARDYQERYPTPRRRAARVGPGAARRRLAGGQRDRRGNAGGRRR